MEFLSYQEVFFVLIFLCYITMQWTLEDYVKMSKCFSTYYVGKRGCGMAQAPLRMKKKSQCYITSKLFLMAK